MEYVTELRQALRNLGRRIQSGDEARLLIWVLPYRLACCHRPLRYTGSTVAALATWTRWEFARIYPEKARRLGISFSPAPASPFKIMAQIWTDSVTEDAQRAGVVEKAEAARRRGDMQALILANIELKQFDAGQVSVCRDVIRFWKSIDDNLDRLRDFAIGWAAFFIVLYILGLSIKWVARGFKRVNA